MFVRTLAVVATLLAALSTTATQAHAETASPAQVQTLVRESVTRFVDTTVAAGATLALSAPTSSRPSVTYYAPSGAIVEADFRGNPTRIEYPVPASGVDFANLDLDYNWLLLNADRRSLVSKKAYQKNKGKWLLQVGLVPHDALAYPSKTGLVSRVEAEFGLFNQLLRDPASQSLHWNVVSEYPLVVEYEGAMPSDSGPMSVTGRFDESATGLNWNQEQLWKQDANTNVVLRPSARAEWSDQMPAAVPPPKTKWSSCAKSRYSAAAKVTMRKDVGPLIDEWTCWESGKDGWTR